MSEESSPSNRMSALFVGALALLGGSGAGTAIQFSPIHQDGEARDVSAIERRIDEIARELSELDDLDDELANLKALQREETRERSRMIREVIRDMRQEMRLYAGSSGGVESSAMDYYMMEAPAAAMEEVPDIVLESPEPEPE